MILICMPGISSFNFAKIYCLNDFPVTITFDIEIRAKASATSAVSAGFELIVLDVPRTMQVSGN